MAEEKTGLDMEFNLEKESLLASGVIENEGFIKYRHKLEELYQQFICSVKLPSDLFAKARLIFEWLWIEKPARYKPHGHFRLNHVIDAQLSENSQTVGNCLGLTLLYNCLVKKIGIHPEASYLENAFGIGPHVLTVLKTETSLIDIEHVLQDGFDYKGHLDDPSRIRWGDRELVADIYHSVGNELFSKGEFIKALENYEMALDLNPQYEKARLNKAILLDKMEMNGKMGVG
jgi:tetratricopeptide (TPR) repeat protein